MPVQPYGFETSQLSCHLGRKHPSHRTQMAILTTSWGNHQLVRLACHWNVISCKSSTIETLQTYHSRSLLYSSRSLLGHSNHANYSWKIPHMDLSSTSRMGGSNASALSSMFSGTYFRPLCLTEARSVDHPSLIPFVICWQLSCCQ